MDHALITNYFPNLTLLQQAQFAALGPCYRSWNERVNVISRKDIDQLYLHHVLHSLAIARYIHFPDGARVLDVGTGGGFPGIPLSILFPQTQFFLCDSTAKKIRVVNEVVHTLGLQNVTSAQVRAEEVPHTFDYAVSRAVTQLARFVPWVWDKISSGILYLKGGRLNKELDACARTVGIARSQIEEISIFQWFSEPFFEEKKIVYICKNIPTKTEIIEQ